MLPAVVVSNLDNILTSFVAITDCVLVSVCTDWCLFLSFENQYIRSFPSMTHTTASSSQSSFSNNESRPVRSRYNRARSHHSTKISGNFGLLKLKVLKLIILKLIQTEKFQKSGSTFRGGPLFPVGPVRSKLTIQFDLFDSFSIPKPRCLLRSIGVTPS